MFLSFVIGVIREKIGLRNYNYLKESHFIYLPISSDYQRRLDKFEDKATLDSITYPREIIEIKKREPFSICISEEFKEDYYYFYPK